MFRFNPAKIKPDAPLTYLLPLLGALLLILIWTALFDYLGREKDQAVRNAVTDTAGHARAFAKHTEQLLRHVDQVARLVQFEFETLGQKGGLFDLAAVVGRSVVPFDGLLLVAVVDREGTPTSVTVPAAKSSGLPLPRLNISADRDPFKIHRDNPSTGIHIGPPAVDPASGRTAIEVTHRLNSGDASFAGVVVVSVDASLFTDFYDTARLGANGVVAILARDGSSRAARTGKNASIVATIDYATMLAALQRAEQQGVPIEDPVDRVHRFMGYRELAGYPLLLRVGTSQLEVLAGYEREKQRYLTYAVMTSLAIIGVISTLMVMIFRLKKSHREAETNRATYKAAAEGSLDAFLLLKRAPATAGRAHEFIVADANSRAFVLFGLTQELVIGNPFAKLVPGSDHLCQRYLDVFTRGTSLEEEAEIVFARRSPRWFRYQVVPLENGAAVTLRDIDDEKHAQANLGRLANQDSLTSLPNRRLFIEHAGSAIERCRQSGTNLCVLFIDLDNFKSVNDSLGHDVGDMLLQTIATRLRSSVRAQDILWRLGGDEFVVTMEDVRARDEAEMICRRMVDALVLPIVIREISISASASIGVAFCPADAQDASTLLRNADLAMYHAKEFGSGAFQFFTPAMGVRRAARVRLEQAIRTAVGRYEMFLVYQPKIDLADRQVVGLEALVRWQHPENGVMQPQEFIPIAEESNLIHLLGDHIFQLACTQIRRWQSLGLAPIPVSVNLSARQFQWEGIVERLLRVISTSGVPPGLVQIELNESAIMKDSQAAQRKLSELNRHGVKLAIDDFGTGHSSLALLQTFPIDTLKIDRLFVEKSKSQEGAAILKAIVLMAHTLRMNVVAEGVETESECAIVRAMGCDQAQGFLFASPATADDIPALLQLLRTRSMRPLQEAGAELSARSPQRDSAGV